MQGRQREYFEDQHVQGSLEEFGLLREVHNIECRYRLSIIHPVEPLSRWKTLGGTHQQRWSVALIR
jgi:hypothetical protein